MNKFKIKIFGLTIAALLSVGALVPATSSALTIDELMAQITALQAELQKLQGTVLPVVSTDKCSFIRSLTVGSKGDDVTCLQNYLTSTGHFTYSGGATGFFGSLTKAAVVKWQSANSVAPAAGYFGSLSRAKYDSLMIVSSSSSSSTTTSTGSSSSSVVATEGGLTVSSATQPVNSLAVKSAAKLPFTKVALTAGTQDVTVTGITVERTGLAVDSVFSGIVLLDETGAQLGIAKTLNSDHRTTVGETVTIKAGQSKTFTIAGNMDDNSSSVMTNAAGQVASLSVVSVVSSATVSGTLPITGASHTINASLSIGSVTMAVGANDPQNSPSKEIGTTGYVFSGVKITAGSSEKVRVTSVRWNQSGSAAVSDFANIKTYVDGTAYDTVVSSDGKYYTSIFGSGIIVDKGANVQILVKGDIVGGSGRTIDFDIYKTTDLSVTGETFGYGITPPNGSDTSGTDDSAFHQSTNPWYDASQVTVSSGTLAVEKASTPAAQPISINTSNQPLGGFVVEAKGEAVSVTNMVFRLSSWAGTGNTASTQDITSITLVDENGSVVAGPVDIAATSPTVTFTDTVTFNVGKKTYTLKGKIGTDFATNQTITASTTPSGWTATGQTTGNSITPTSSVITANTMTVKAAVITASLSASPASQAIVANKQAFNFANIQLDATASGEDIKFNTIPLTFTNGGTASHIAGCKLKDGSSELNASNVVDTPSASQTFTLDNGLTVSKGTVKTIGLYCNVSGSATTSSTYLFGIPAAASWSATGLGSSQSATITASAASSGTMTIGAASFTVALDTANNPSYSVIPANTTGNVVASLKFNASNDNITLQKLSLQLTSTASSSSSDLVRVTLWDDSVYVGSAEFTGTNTNATSTLTGSFVIPKDGENVMTVKLDVADIGQSAAIKTGGRFIAIDYDGADSTGTQGGDSAGNTINTSSTGDTASNGARVHKSYPMVTKLAVPSSTLNNGTMSIYRFKVSGNSTGNVGLYKVTLQVSTSTASVTNLNVYAYTDSAFSSPISGVNTGGKLMQSDIAGIVNSTDVNVVFDNAGTATAIQIPANGSRYFDVVATVAGTATGATVSTQMQGDAAYPSIAACSTTSCMLSAGGVDGDTNDDFIWSDNATTTAGVNTNDFTNGYGLPGFSTTNMSAEVISK